MLWESSTPKPVKHFLLSDWGIPAESIVRSIAAIAVACYVLGAMAHDWVVELSDSLAAAVVTRPTEQPWLTHWKESAAQGKPAGSQAEHDWRRDNTDARPYDSTAAIRYACAPVVARCGIQAPDPMSRAMAAVLGGHSSQAAAARRYGVSRSTLRRRLAR